MRILSVGSLSGMSNTCLHRNWALHKVADEVDEINTQLNPIKLWGRICYHLFFLGLPIRIPENNKENEKICKMVKNKDYDMRQVRVECCDKKIGLMASDITAGFYCPYCGRIIK